MSYIPRISASPRNGTCNPIVERTRFTCSVERHREAGQEEALSPGLEEGEDEEEDEDLAESNVALNGLHFSLSIDSATEPG